MANGYKSQEDARRDYNHGMRQTYKNIGGFWKRTSKQHTNYFKGKINIDGQEIEILVFENMKKKNENENEYDYRITISEYEHINKDKRNSAESSTNKNTNKTNDANTNNQYSKNNNTKPAKSQESGKAIDYAIVPAGATRGMRWADVNTETLLKAKEYYQKQASFNISLTGYIKEIDLAIALKNKLTAEKKNINDYLGDRELKDLSNQELEEIKTKIDDSIIINIIDNLLAYRKNKK